MRKGSTPKFSFTIPFDKENVNEFKITFKQNSEIVLEKYLKDMQYQDGKYVLELTQEETFIFNDGVFELQGRVLTKGGDCLTSDVRTVPSLRCLDDEVLE